jgi:hypothetical protein
VHYRPSLKIKFEPFVASPVVSTEGDKMMPDQLARQEQIARRLEQSKRLLRDAKDPTTNERIGKLIGDLEHEQAEEKEK